ncbi:hypothetical protein GCM10023185_29740 [Hymenobacter saemangeumensis]|uniref:Uncharacterized protein n=1 Tax=Hymenobacter saemangeumensis TaxID=1084522 RepID=A0ABP8IL43_9BACT
MATPVQFDEANTVLRAAPGTESWVRDLPIYRQYADGVNDQCVVSCWELSPEEQAEVARTGRVYFQCFGTTHPPVSIWGTTPFRQPEEASR